MDATGHVLGAPRIDPRKRALILRTLPIRLLSSRNGQAKLTSALTNHSELGSMESENMTPDQIEIAKRSAYFFIAVSVCALTADFTAIEPIAPRYVLGAIVLIGFCGTVLDAIHKGFFGNSN